MSDTSPDKAGVSGSSQALGIREKLEKTREDAQISHVQAPLYQNLQRHQSQPINTRGTPILPRSDRRLSQMSIAEQSSRSSPRKPSRLEVQPVMPSKDLFMPVRHSQSVPHTPTNPSKLSMHKEASPAQTVTLQPMWLTQAEFIIPLAMQPRILSHYMDTLEYYKRAVMKNMTNETLSRSDLDKLNELLGRLANVATHIGLVGGGPGSQKEVLPEQEAAYAESSSEKFSFLGHLLTFMKDNPTHIAIICKFSLLDIVELFLKGKKVRYSRPDTRTTSDTNTNVIHSRLEVSLIASGELGASVMPRSADLVVALDETFKSSDPQVMALRKQIIKIDQLVGQLAPVVRLVVYSSVEHLDLCFHPTLDPIDRIWKLIFYVFHTQEIIGRLQSHEPSARSFAEKVAAILRSRDIKAFWDLPRIGPIENLPAMDLSDPLSERAIEQMRPEGPARYWPNPVLSRIGEPGNQIIQGVKRPFDLEYGDTFEVQTKKQKMAARAHRGLPVEELSTIENLKRQLAEAKDREITDLQRWAGIRQNDFEKSTADLNRKTHDLENSRAEIDVLKEERTALKETVTDLCTQLSNHSNPDLARLEKSAAKSRTLEFEIASVNRKNANLQSESRGVYASSSSIFTRDESRETRRKAENKTKNEAEMKIKGRLEKGKLGVNLGVVTRASARGNGGGGAVGSEGARDGGRGGKRKRA